MMCGFGNHFSSEQIPGALPQGQNNPQKAPQGLITELLSGSAFTRPRHENRSVWLYRKTPSVIHSSYEYLSHSYIGKAALEAPSSPNRHRWSPLPIAETPHDFIQGLKPYCQNGSPSTRSGCQVYLYTANQSMNEKCFFNSDGDFLIVPEKGSLRLTTELGRFDVSPLDIALIPRGLKFKVDLLNKQARGYVCENYGQPLRIPDRGPIGSHGLANERDFETPTVFAEDMQKPYELITKSQGHLWKASLGHSPFDVVAWHGTYVPFKYNLKNFMPINAVGYDHPDPSIFTVLTSPSAIAGLANIDFVIFPPRWVVAENTFRPPYYHRNVMSEFMGLIEGEYDAKDAGDRGFQPGGASLHNCMSAHGPDAKAFKKASDSELKPERYQNTMAFMFETNNYLTPYQWILDESLYQKDYDQCWSGIGT